MTDTEINIAIAEAIGETIPQWVKDRNLNEWWDGPGYTNPREIKDFCHDLNAMHEAEGVLDKEKLHFTYSHNLYNIVVPLNIQPFRATARQRAEAFLRTTGKWLADGEQY